MPTEGGNERRSVEEAGWLLTDEEQCLPVIQNASGAVVAQFTALIASAHNRTHRLFESDGT